MRDRLLRFEFLKFNGNLTCLNSIPIFVFSYKAAARARKDSPGECPKRRCGDQREAPEGRKTVAHGASRGKRNRYTDQPRKGRQKTQPIPVGQILSPLRGLSGSTLPFPGLTPRGQNLSPRPGLSLVCCNRLRKSTSAPIESAATGPSPAWWRFCRPGSGDSRSDQTDWFRDR